MLAAYTHIVTAATASIVTDGTLGLPGTTLDGPNYQIPESLGKRAGHNLFHSFYTFNIRQGESAVFTGSDSIQNVISRVTGGSPSTIDGTLRSEIGHANFYFLNPWGVIFGANAQIDVPGGFHVGTGTELTFPDGNAYSARAEGSSLSIEPPEAFGFRTAKAGPITIDQSSFVFKPKTTITLAGGEVNIKAASLKSESGEIRLVAVGSAGGDMEAPLMGGISNAAQGRLSITDSTIHVNGDAGGYLGLAAESIEINGGKLENTNLGNEDARQGTEVRARILTMSRNSEISNNARGAGDAPSLRVEARGGGNAGSIGESPCVLCIDGESQLYSQASGSGKAADMMISASGKMQVVKSRIYSGTQGKGNSGNVTVRAEELLLDGRDRSRKGIKTYTENVGNAGAITVTVQGFLRIANQAGISSYSINRENGKRPPRGTPSIEAIGNAGSVTVQAGSLRIDGVVQEYRKSGIWSHTSLYPAPRSLLPRYGSNTGDVKVTVAGLLELVDRAEIYTQTAGLGNAGDVSVRTGSLRMYLTERPRIQGNKLAEIKSIGGKLGGESLPAYDRGKAGNVSVAVDGKLEMRNAVAIRRETFGDIVSSEGDDRAVIVQTGSLLMSGKERIMGGPGNKIDRLYPQIKTTANHSAKQKPGNVMVVVNGTAELNLAEIFSETASHARPGNISIRAGDLKIQNSKIYSGTPKGKWVDTGNITITVHRQMDLIQGEILSSGGNHPGAITVKTGSLSMNSGTISNDSSGSKNAKGITITLDNTLRLSNRATISTGTKGSGNAGDITIAADMINLSNESRIFSVSNAATSTRGNAGAVIMTSDALRLDRSHIFNTGARPSIEIKLPDQYENSGMSFFRSGGANTVSVTVLGKAEISNGSNIFSSTAWAGNAGPITIKAKELRVDGGRIYGDTAVGMNTVRYKIHPGTHQAFNGKPILDQLLAWEDASSKIDGEKVTITAHGLQFTINSSEAIVATDGVGTLNYVGDNPQVAPGNVPVKVTVAVSESLKLSNGAQIDTSTEGIVGAGEIHLTGRDVWLDNAVIASGATSTSHGQVGGIRIDSNTTELTNGSRIGIQNEAKISDQRLQELTPKEITIRAMNRVRLLGGSKVSTRASGNTDAGHIMFDVGRELSLENSAITTRAQQAQGGQGDGGDITIQFADGWTRLINSQITTSSTAGKGGDIRVHSDILLLNGGIIQANTAQGAKGGDITIDAFIIIPGDQTLRIGDDVRQTSDTNSIVNVIEAHAPPVGEKGVIRAPLDISLSKTLTSVRLDFQNTTKITDNPCRVDRGMAPSSLVQAGRGALPTDVAGIWNGLDSMPGIPREKQFLLPHEGGRVSEVAANNPYTTQSHPLIDTACRAAKYN